mmetsp:Transcript_114348/g.180580  ORF Transcript_114348/g.180580 Transcript_114348/m.180580 type:complete len:214 (-) Transcript_114348:1307-1948(-)
MRKTKPSISFDPNLTESTHGQIGNFLHKCKLLQCRTESRKERRIQTMLEEAQKISKRKTFLSNESNCLRTTAMRTKAWWLEARSWTRRRMQLCSWPCLNSCSHLSCDPYDPGDSSGPENTTRYETVVHDRWGTIRKFADTLQMYSRQQNLSPRSACHKDTARSLSRTCKGNLHPISGKSLLTAECPHTAAMAVQPLHKTCKMIQWGNPDSQAT